MDFRREPVVDLAARVRAGELGARELVAHAYERIDALDGTLGAFVAQDREAAHAAARALDERVARGDDVGPLAGLPLAVKDNEDVAGYRTTMGSALLADAPVAEHDSIGVARLRAAGAVVVGKTNLPELAHKGETDSPLFGVTRNPWDTERSPGGSSGGTAAALAAGMVPLGTGSDGGGSIRIPAALCGLSGIKCSLGRVPVGGSTPPGWLHLSTRGPMAMRVRDSLHALDVVVGPHPTDPTSLPPPESRWSHALDELRPPHRVAWSPDLGYGRVDREVREICESAVRRLEREGTEVIELDGVFPADPGLAWATIAYSCERRSLEPWRETPDWEKVDPGLRRLVDMAAERFGALELLRALDECHVLHHRLTEVLHGVNALVCPTLAGQAPVIGAGGGTVDGEVGANWISFTYPFNMTRSPAGTVCAGFTAGGLPVGLQVVGAQHADVAVLRTMAVLEDLLALDRLAPLPA